MDRRKLQQAIAGNSHFTDSRKVSLYSNFSRLEESNPDGYVANLAAWKEVLQDAVKLNAFQDRTCISAGPELTTKLGDVSNGIPMSLNRVLDAMVADGTLMPLPMFKKQYATGPTSGAVSRIFGWAFSKLTARPWVSSTGGPGDVLKQEKYVDIQAVKSGAAKLVSELTESSEKQGKSYSSQIFNFSSLNDVLPEWTQTDIECCLAFAKSQNHIYFDPQSDVIKLKSAGAITDVDSNITSLRKHIYEVSRREATLAQQVSGYEQQARDVIKTNRKAAKLLLQKKAIAEKSQDRTLAVMDQLEAVLRKIDDASDNKQAYAAFQSSSALLSKVNKGLSVSEVDDIVERLHDEMSTTDEVTASLADLNIGSEREMNEMELDEELDLLAQEEESKKLDKLPSVPQHKPHGETETSEETHKEKSEKTEDRQTEERQNEQLVSN